MIIKDGSSFVRGVTQPIRTMAQRSAYIVLVLLAFAIILFGKMDPVLVERVRINVVDAATPMLNITSKISETVYGVGKGLADLYEIRKKNGQLVVENKRLFEWQAVAHKLERENIALKNLLNFVPDREASFITARAVADTSGAFANSLILNAGKSHHVKRGQAAITGDGLVGRVAGVGLNSARILLATDLNSRVPVVIYPGNIRAILAGDNSNYPKLIHLPPGAVIEQGERIVTSGHGGAFPPGLPVGVIKSVGDGANTVRLYADRSKLFFVRLLDYGIQGIVETPPFKNSFASGAKKPKGR